MLRYKYIPAPFSIYNNCMKLEPGTHLVLDTESFKVNLEKYWQSTPAKIECSFEDATKRLDKLLNDAVVRRMVSDVPIGAMLSGGIDSSLVCAIMQKNSATKINSFSIGFHEKEYNEAPYAKAIAEHLGTQHTQLYLQAYDIKDTIPSMVDVFDEPFSDPSQIPTFMISKLIKKHVTVCLSGDGGDELFLGYQRYEEAQRRYSYINRVPAPIRKPVSKAILSIATLLKHDGGKVLARHINSRDIYQLYDQLLSDWHRDSKILNDVQTLPKIEGLTLEKDSSLEQLAYLDYNYYLPDDILTKVDRTSMWHSLELRVPLLDHTVVEYAHSLPIDKKIRDGSQKALLKALLKQYIPEKLFLRPKMGFAIPIDHWLKTDLKDWGGDLLNSNNAKEYLNHRLIKKMWEAHQNNAGQWHFPLWNILMFLAWKEAV
jgi:asparagine synthase (glutamine-hydrolysing)